MIYRYGDRVRLTKEWAERINPTTGTVAKRKVDGELPLPTDLKGEEFVWVNFDLVDQPLASPTLVPVKWLERAA